MMVVKHDENLVCRAVSTHLTTGA